MNLPATDTPPPPPPAQPAEGGELSLRARLLRFIADPAAERFEDLALAAFAYQFARIPAFRTLTERAGRTPDVVRAWQDIPSLPAVAFKHFALHTDPPLEVFRSSGTTATAGAAAGATAGAGAAGTPTATTTRSVHHHPFPELYRAAIDNSFPQALLEPGERPAMLSLVPSRAVLPDSSLAFMLDHVLAQYGDPARSLVAAGSRGVELAKARSWLGARQREGRPVVVLATSLALAQLLDGLGRIELRFRLPVGSRLFETGGAKGRERELDTTALAAACVERLGIPPSHTVREYGMTELSSQLYTAPLRGGPPDVFLAPHWVRVRVLDPDTLEETAVGTPGLVTVLDLANMGSAVHLLTEDLGVRVELGGVSGIRLLGRASGAELRGCSLTAEELAVAAPPR